MEKTQSDELKLPIGFRFRPTDVELLVHYVRRKVLSLPLPAAIVPEFDVFQFNPWDLPGDLKEKRHFFCKRKTLFINKWNSGSFGTERGYWKSTGKDKQIMAPGSNLVLGIKKSYVFYQQNKSRAQKTRWIMHNLCLVGSISTPFFAQKLMMQVGDWVACRVYERKRKARNNGRVNQLLSNSKNLRMEGNNNELGFSTSSCSSAVTEISSNSDLDQEINSHL